MDPYVLTFAVLICSAASSETVSGASECSWSGS
jgi:hypothetical protein